jgi:SAM-dependent methyltransferase
MTDFSADWLALREPADEAARSQRLTQALAAACSGKPQLRIVDLGAGSGANLQFLSPRLHLPQHWRLLDHNAALLQHALNGTRPLKGATAEAQRLDLAGDLARLDLEAVDVVTASALMDLVSAEWFDRLAGLCRAAGALLLFVLTYDGRIDFQSPDPFDARLIELFNRHQTIDKGFGPALGPEAPAYMAGRLRKHGFRIETGPSDWHLDAQDAPLQDALLTNYAEVAQEIDPVQASDIADWLRRRRAILSEGASRLTVGHVDLLAVP